MIILFHYVYVIALCVREYVMKSYNKKRRTVSSRGDTVERKVIVNNDVCRGFCIKFTPPAYVQRYQAVCKILEDDRWSGAIRKVIDFGCAELAFFPYLKNVPGIQEILEVDIDKDVLKRHKCRAAPLTSDYLKKRCEPLAVHVLAGSIAEQDSRLRGTDAVICIELIEHLYPDTLEALPHTVFEYVQPKVAIFTTPNSDFNVLLPNISGFRHDDHKFEWSRKQFTCWAKNLTTRYPSYSVSFVGIAPGPDGTAKYGCCSQMAVFVKASPASCEDVQDVDPDIEHENVYKLMDTYIYPFEADTRTVEEKIRDEATYCISSCGPSHVYDTENDNAHIPLEVIMPAVKKWCDSINKLREVLEDSCWQVEEFRGELCVLYSHRRWSHFLTGDDEEDGDIEEAAASTACEQDTMESSPCAREEDTDKLCGNVLYEVPAGERDDGLGVRNYVCEPESCDISMPVNSVQEGTSVFSATDCGIGPANASYRKSCPFAVEVQYDKGDVFSVKNNVEGMSKNTSDQGQTDSMLANCDTRSVGLPNGHVITENKTVNDGGFISEHLGRAENRDPGAQVSNVVNISDLRTSESCDVNKSENDGNRQCGSLFLVGGCAQQLPEDSVEQKVIVNSDVILDSYGIRFIPPAYVQRYVAVCKILEHDRWNGAIRKVIDFGCAELGFFQYMKNVRGIQEILEVDVDKDVLKYNKCRAAPLTSDYLKKRCEPLAVRVLAGSIAEQDSRLRGTDAVICIELIEHLYPDTLEALPYTVFEYIQPKVAIFTTPNSEFNVLLPNFSGFRHYDHKFEWTRQQFTCWAQNLTTRYPLYSVSFVGIAPGPDGTSQYGCCSQMAVFVKATPASNEDVQDVDPDIEHENVYELMDTYIYPFEADTRTVEEKIRDEATYCISCCGPSHLYDTENDNAHIPLEVIMPAVEKWCDSINKLRKVLEDSCWQVEEFRGELCVLYSHRRWSHFLTGDDEDDEYDDMEEAAVPPSCEQDTVECSPCAREEEDWGPAESHGDTHELCWNTLDKVPGGELEDGRSMENCVDGSESCRSLVPVNSVLEGASVLGTADCSVMHSEQDCYVGQGDANYRELPGKSYPLTPELHDISSDQNYVEKWPNYTGSRDQAELVFQNCDSCDKGCDTSVVEVPNGHVVTEVAYVDNSELITERLGHAVNGDPVAQVCDVVQTVVNLSNCYITSKSCNVKKSEHDVDRQCGSPSLVDGCAQNKMLSRNLEVALEEGSTVDSYSLEEQNDKAVDSGYPNSTDMDLDLTPEQVDEISTENDVLLTENSSFDEDSENEASRSDSEADPIPPVLHRPGEILHDAADEGMENGDVANNNQDEEGNNAAALAPHPQVGDAAVIDFAVMLDLENENDLANVEPFPNWLLHLLGVANLGDGGEAAEPWSDDDDSSSVSMHGSEQVSSTVSLQGALDDATIH